MGTWAKRPPVHTGSLPVAQRYESVEERSHRAEGGSQSAGKRKQMRQGFLRDLFKFPSGLETQGRDKLLAGFVLLLLLICFTGYWGQKSLEEVELRTAEMRATNAHHLRIALGISRVAGEMAPEVREEIVTRDHNPYLHFASNQHLHDLKREMDDLFDEGRTSSLGLLPEFLELQSSFAAFWAAVTSDDPLAQGWDTKRNRMEQLTRDLEEYTGKERELTEQQGAELTRHARLRIGL